jgi:hypothetical protein
MGLSIGGEPGDPPDLGTETAVRRYLMYGLLPAWFVPGILDWRLHKRTRIEHTSGLRESLIHALMMTEVGVPLLGALLLQVNRRVLAIMGVAAVVHEATAIWDVRTAYDSTREVAPNEQHVHAFLETLPFTAVAAMACLHWNELRRPSGKARPWLRSKSPPVPTGYVAAILGSVGLLVVLPYGEELVRCWRSGRGQDVDADVDVYVDENADSGD